MTEDTGIQVIQRRPNTCVVVTSGGKEYVGFSKVCWPDHWDPRTGMNLALGKAVAQMWNVKVPKGDVPTSWVVWAYNDLEDLIEAEDPSEAEDWVDTAMFPIHTTAPKSPQEMMLDSLETINQIVAQIKETSQKPH